MTSDNGTLIGSVMKYMPYGTVRSGEIPTDRLFTGQRYDDTGLYYYGARYYDPEIGRFISPDTIVPDPMNPQSFNRYSYCLNNPLKYIDPTGHWGEVSENGYTIDPRTGEVIHVNDFADPEPNMPISDPYEEIITINQQPVFLHVWAVNVKDVPNIDSNVPLLTDAISYLSYYANAPMQVSCGSHVLEKIYISSTISYSPSTRKMSFSLDIDVPYDSFFYFPEPTIETIGVDAFHKDKMVRVDTDSTIIRFEKTFNDMPFPENINIMRIHIDVWADPRRTHRTSYQVGYSPWSIIANIKSGFVGVH
ncbi:MAG: RHS repeat-associated core domain-containing protein [Dehalococcoidales bacterium]|nr:RHS repeat-associated core domain-containing protein [Dehalococcoidales bacterium]